MLLLLRKILILVLLFGFVLSPTAVAVVGEAPPNSATLVPSKVFMDAERGDHTKVDLSVASTFAIPFVIYKIDAWDFALDSEGKPTPIPATDAGRFYGASRWLKMPSDKILVDPKKTAKFTVNINVPKNARLGTHYAYVRISMKPVDEKKDSVKINLQINSMLLVTLGKKGSPAQLKRVLKLIEFKAPAVAWSAFGFDNIIENKGNVHETVKGKVEILNGKQTVSRTSLGEHTVLPESKLRFKGKMRNLPLIGRYKLVATFSGGPRTLRAAREFIIISPSVLIITIILLVLLMWAIWFFIRFKKNYKIVRKDESS